ncbi:CDP-glycerol glycerophosphotransferase family protein [Staphylococcus simulans]
MELTNFDYNFCFVQTNLPDLVRLSLRNGKSVEIHEHQLTDKDIELGKLNVENGLVAMLEKEDNMYYVHVKDEKLYITPYLNGKTKGSLNLEIETYHSRFRVAPTLYSYQVTDSYTGESIELGASLFEKGRKPFVVGQENHQGDPAVFLKFKYEYYTTFLEYTHSKKDFSFKTQLLELLTKSELHFDFQSANELIITSPAYTQVVRLSDLNQLRDVKLAEAFKPYVNQPIYFQLNDKFYIINCHNQKLSIKTDEAQALLYQSSTIDFKKTRRHIILYGQINYNAPIQPDSLMTKEGIPLAQMKWTSSNTFEAKIKIKQLRQLTEIHNTVFTAVHGRRFHVLHQSPKLHDKRKVLLSFNTKGHAIILRRNAADNLSFGNLPALKIYHPWHKFKINLAYRLAPFYKRLHRKQNLNVYFEKEASKAVESGKYVFEAAAGNQQFKSKNVFILDQTSPQYKAMKRRWKDKIVERFSFRNYLYVFASDYFIASELSNHVINTRLFNDRLNEKIKATPLYFLQHGITFLKPRDNAKQVGFHKKNMTNNIVKSVVSSEVEAKIFNEMAYNDFELMMTGMPKFDHAHLDKDADKITYMPTWRPWEEAAVFNGQIEETTYYQSIMEVIKVFEQAGMLDRLQIAAHNKFAHYAKHHFKNYNHLFIEDPTDTLKNSVIFITDISSIIFDAINHGAFPIFYWKEFEEIIHKHGGTTPANRDNVPGVVADDEDELIEAVKTAINNDYRLPKQVLTNYRRINAFHDNQNTQRVIDELTHDGVL